MMAQRASVQLAGANRRGGEGVQRKATNHVVAVLIRYDCGWICECYNRLAHDADHACRLGESEQRESLQADGTACPRSKGRTAMSDAEQFEVSETLRNGVSVKLRAIRPSDKAGIVDAFGKLDPESVYTRFFQVKGAFSDEELSAATEVDFENVIALVVTVESGGKEIVIGGGRYVAFDFPGARSAEIAFLVEEDYHGLGIAGRILKHLAGIAREKGVSRFEAEVLPQNRAMLAVFAKSGLPMTRTPTADAIHVTLSLAEQPLSE